MHRLITLASMTLLATSGLMALGTGAALAAGNAPSCDSYNLTLTCTPTAGSAPWTWTVTERVDGITDTWTAVANEIHGGCDRGAGYTLSYSYVSGGVTFDSASTTIACNPNPPE